MNKACVWTTWIYAAVFTLSTVLYVLPYTRDTYNAWPGQYSSNNGESTDADNVAIRIIIPIVLFVAATLMTRFW